MFTPKERKIFKFNNGSRVVARDPVRLWRKLEATRPKNYDQLVQDFKSGDPEKYSAVFDIMVPWLEELFGVHRLNDDSEGLTEDELFAVLADFMEFTDKKKDDTETTPNSSPSSPELTPSVVANSPTPTASDCGCTG